jgi:hypothetical protein
MAIRWEARGFGVLLAMLEESSAVGRLLQEVWA